MRKKTLFKKTAALSMAALLGLATVSSSAFAADTYTQAEEEAWGKMVKKLTESVADSLKKDPASLSEIHGDLSLKLEDAGRSLLGLLVPFDVSWLKGASVSMDAALEEDNFGTVLKVLLNDSQVCSMEIYMDPVNQIMYAKIPELSDKYMKASLSDIEEGEVPETDGNLSDLFTIASAAVNSMPEASLQEEVLSRYGNMIFDSFDNEEEGPEALTAGGVSQDCTLYKGKITSAAGIKAAEDILASARSDEQIKDILQNWEAQLPQNEGFYDKFQSDIDKGLEQLKEAQTSDSDSYLVSSLWVTEKGRVAGRDITLVNGQESTPVFTWKTTGNKEDRGLLISLNSDDSSISLEGSGKVTDGLLSGSYQLTMDSTPCASIEVSDYNISSAKEGEITGTYTISLIASGEDDQSSSLENLALIVNLASEGETSSINLSVTSAGSSLGTLSLASSKGEKIQMPDLTSITDAYDMDNEQEAQEYTSTMDFNAIMDNLTQAGMPQEVLDSLLNGEENEIPEAETDEAGAENAAE